MVYSRGEPLARQTLDMVVDDKLVAELKSTTRLDPGATRQLVGYLSVTDVEVGLLLHFGPEPKFYPLVCPNSRKQGRIP